MGVPGAIAAMGASSAALGSEDRVDAAQHASPSLPRAPRRRPRIAGDLGAPSLAQEVEVVGVVDDAGIRPAAHQRQPTVGDVGARQPDPVERPAVVDEPCREVHARREHLDARALQLRRGRLAQDPVVGA
ncbi:MAG: hypothetical protein U0869_01145 [Chloroflexota bacterium]